MLVRENMTKEPVTVTPHDTLLRAHTRMRAGGFRRLPVMVGDKMVGILSEYDLRRYLESLDTTLVETAMTRDPVTVSPWATLEHAVALLRSNEIGALPVVEHGRLIGIVTASNLWIPEPRPLPQWQGHV
jgi:acetoin utilization protein AcuB